MTVTAERDEFLMPRRAALYTTSMQLLGTVGIPPAMWRYFAKHGMLRIRVSTPLRLLREPVEVGNSGSCMQTIEVRASKMRTPGGGEVWYMLTLSPATEVAWLSRLEADKELLASVLNGFAEAAEDFR